MSKLCKYKECPHTSCKRGMCEKHYRKWWRTNNADQDKEYSKQYYNKNIKDKRAWNPINKNCTECKTVYMPTGKNQKYCCKTCQNNSNYRKKLKNPNHKLKHNLRSRLRKALKGKSKDKSTVDLLGCSIERFKVHLETQFQPGMTWDNYGKWHIDHIRPLSGFDLTSAEELKIVCCYKNLQPLWAKDNISKGG